MLALTVIVDLCAKWHFGFMEVKDKVPESQLDLPEVLEDVPNWTLVMLVLTQIVPVQSCYCPDCVHDGLLQPINVRQELGHICSCSAEFWGDQKEKRSSSQSVTSLTPQRVWLVETRSASTASYLIKSPSRPMTRLMIFCWGFLGELRQNEERMRQKRQREDHQHPSLLSVLCVFENVCLPQLATVSNNHLKVRLHYWCLRVCLKVKNNK